MTKKVLLTCFGGNVFYEVYMDFQKRNDIELFICDMNPEAKSRILTENFIPVYRADHPQYVDDLLEKAKANRIAFIIPGSDEEAFILSRYQQKFQDEGIEVAVQEEGLVPILQSKAALYDDLKQKDFPVPSYQRVLTREDFRAALDVLDYPHRPLLVKPNAARGGRGITLLTEEPIENKDNLSMMNQDLFEHFLDGTTEFLIMEYVPGIVYDIDVLVYRSGEIYFGARKRFNNVTKLFSGNVFDDQPGILDFARKLYDVFPTRYLVDYDFMVTDEGRIVLLEINPRPSGSTVSYLPFGVNLYYVLAKSYLDGEDIPIPDSLRGQQAVTFYKMVEGRV